MLPKKGSPEYEALEVLCKGLEVSLPYGVSFFNKHGITRTKVRVPWWLKPTYSTYKNEALVAEEIRKFLPEIPMMPDARIVKYDGIPVFVGHYWLNDLESTPLASNIACVDFSAGRDGPLVAYRWSGEAKLSSNGFVTKVTHVAS